MTRKTRFYVFSLKKRELVSGYYNFIIIIVDFKLIDYSLVFAFEALASSYFDILDQFVDIFKALSVLCCLNNRTLA